jgi:hypothetical protein
VADVRAGVLHVDTSALVKLVVREAESDALEQELRRWGDLATSVLTSVELSRAVARARSDGAAVLRWPMITRFSVCSPRWPRFPSMMMSVPPPQRLLL